MVKWLHHLFNPHCPECDVCKSCESYKEVIAHLKYENEKLLRYILEPKGEMQSALPEADGPVPIKPKIIPWAVQQKMLEAEDRQKAVILKKRNEEIEKLEQELKIDSNLKLEIPNGDSDVQSGTK